jgi:hypothetical protein
MMPQECPTSRRAIRRRDVWPSPPL